MKKKNGPGCCKCSGTGTGGIGTIPNCTCTAIPGSLSMVSANTTCNYGMFQSCAIQWGPTPPEYASLNLGVNSFLSTADFPDIVAGGARFRYYLACVSSRLSITRVYLESPYGSPFRDISIYSWLTGAAGNSCVPFRLINGAGFPGSDPACHVEITG